jgi:hypothetical protein
MVHQTEYETVNEAGHGRRVMAGCAVYTRDGEHLGTVKEVREGYFKVDVKMRPDYWLQTQFVELWSDDRVTLEFPKGDLGDYKVKELPERLADGRLVDVVEPTPEGDSPENPAAATLGETERRGT